MKPGLPWSVKGIEPDVREAAKLAARRSGMTLGEWLNSTILEQADGADVQPVAAPRARATVSAPSIERTTSRLEDIAESSPAFPSVKVRLLLALAFTPRRPKSGVAARRCLSLASFAGSIHWGECMATSQIKRFYHRQEAKCAKSDSWQIAIWKNGSNYSGL